MSNIRKLPEQNDRVETGAVQFGSEDNPGVFIRGDDCYMIYMELEEALTGESWWDGHIVEIMQAMDDANGGKLSAVNHE